ncbi:MAG: hypothetical protein BJ554DRAFT_490 [Olpidium bornovanus]|uniref:Uncharacterized protein n=1 Tax=Olpidium bornovanus TaxID=278681 RepID=A0A8H8DHT4_9FUNG|nr:MAG: hypothetical protein BJ554DRAFT_490 [Olpidium bornovanus]
MDAFWEQLPIINAACAEESVSQATGESIKRAKLASGALKQLVGVVEKPVVEGDHEEAANEENVGEEEASIADDESQSSTRFSAVSSTVPCSESWETALNRASAEEQPHRRLSITAALRTTKRAQVAENTLQLVCEVIQFFEGNDYSTYQDLGDLIDYLSLEVNRWPLTYHSAVDNVLRHLLRMGRPMRNSPVHVQQHGDERTTWDSDFIAVTRVAVHVAFAQKLYSLHDWDKHSRINQPVAFAATTLKQLVTYTALSSRLRAVSTSQYADAKANAVKANGIWPAGALDGVGTLKWLFLKAEIDDLVALAKTELQRVLRKFRLSFQAGSSLSLLCFKLTRLSQRTLEEKGQLRFYGGTKFTNLTESVCFAEEAAKAAGPSDEIDLSWTLVHLDSFAELFATLREHLAVSFRGILNMIGVNCHGFAPMKGRTRVSFCPSGNFGRE